MFLAPFFTAELLNTYATNLSLRGWTISFIEVTFGLILYPTLITKLVKT
jgi:hypothetical protein